MDTLISPVEPETATESKSNWQLIVASDQGPRTENQDNYLVITPQGQYEYLLDEKKQRGTVLHWPEGYFRLVIADGMGGHNNGRQASEAVVQALLKMPFQTDPEPLRDELLNIHNQLFNQFHQGGRTPGSTLVMADITPDGHAVIANIGDSRAYLYQDTRWKLLSRDHSEAEFAYRDKEISEQAYAKSLLQNTNHIVQAMIFGSSGIIADSSGVKHKQHLQALRIELEKDVFTQQIKKGDVLMLASDGVWSGRENYLVPATIETDLGNYAAQQRHDALKVARDNVSFIFYSLRK
jgi:serine/threonine protein phosphatase PrpC